MSILDDILDFLHYHPESSRRVVEEGIYTKASPATVKRTIASAIDSGLVIKHGIGKASVYSITPKAHLLRTVDLDSYYALDFDKRQVQTGYNFKLIRETMPVIDIFTAEEKVRLAKCQSAFSEHMADLSPTGYNKEMERLGIDLSWKSSEIEGNTYTLLETVNLLKDKIEAKGKKREEAMMLLNHKEALKAIVEQPHRAALLLFYEQNNLSAFKRIFIDQAEFAVNEYF